MELEKAAGIGDNSRAKPGIKLKIALAVVFLIGILLVFLMLIAFVQILPKILTNDAVIFKKISDLTEMTILLAGSACLTAGAARMWFSEKKGWGLLFFGSSVIPFFIILNLGTGMISGRLPGFSSYTDYLFLLAVGLVIFFLAIFAVMLFSPRLRSIPGTKEIAVSLAITGGSCLLLLATFSYHFFIRHASV